MKKVTPLTPFILAATIGAFGLLVGCASQSALRQQARVTQADAEKIALAQAPNGTIKDAELEKEHGPPDLVLRHHQARRHLHH